MKADERRSQAVFRRQNGSVQGNASELSKQEALERVARAMEQVRFGEIVVKMQGGKPVWVDKYERERVG